ncbi:hypothetical protein EHE21_09595 [Proteus sp. GOKU]|uniref:hypothetical protein n=1 Tax=Proteus TaxID=583 RepID=UPI001892B6FF|nr:MULTISPECIES: hypothetical protein [Proteus]QPB79620.1 hypothetical protein EHE21_09595 [Proteus sp. GOKU]QQP25627.1 hypothetical protein D7029_09595 [Proteus vulgaris]
MKVLNEGVNYKKITKLSDNSPSDVMSVWEKIKDWFGFSQQKKVLTLIKNIYFNQDATIFEKNKDFFHLKKLAGEQYKNNFKYSVNNDEIFYLIDFGDESIKSKSSILPFIETIKNELNLDLKNYSNEDLDAFINNYYKLSTLNNTKINFEEKFIAFRAILMECMDANENPLSKQGFSLDCFDEKKSFNDKCEYLKENSEKYFGNLNTKKLIDNIYDSANQHKYKNLREQVEKDIPRYDLKFNNENISDISVLEGKLKPLNNKDTMIIFELLNQGVFPMIKDSFEEHDPIASMYSPFTGETSVNIKNEGNLYTIIVNNKKRIAESDIEKVSQLSNFILNDFDYNSMNLYMKNFVDSPVSKETLDASLALYQSEIERRKTDRIGDKFNYKGSRFALLEENMNIKFEFNPDLMKKLSISTNESKVEYSLLKS